MRIFDLIEPDHISPQERARMFDEHGEEALREEEAQKRESARVLQIAKAMFAKGFDNAMIAELTGLSKDELSEL